MNPRIDTPELRVISSLLSNEICRPLDDLQAGLARLLADTAQPPTATERSHALTMLELCDDLRRLTWDCLGDASALAGTAATQADDGAVTTTA